MGFLVRQALELPQNKSNPNKVMPQNKNLTQIDLSEGGFGGYYGVNNVRKECPYK
jgi:hypothetical protein